MDVQEIVNVWMSDMTIRRSTLTSSISSYSTSSLFIHADTSFGGFYNYYDPIPIGVICSFCGCQFPFRYQAKCSFCGAPKSYSE